MSCDGSYGVLMAVYAGERAEHLRLALKSIFAQTLPPAETVLVCDGPLTNALEAEIAAAKACAGDALKVVRLEKNSGLGAALNFALPHCSREYIARMDSDDISRPDRCEKQLAFMRGAALDLSSGAIAEFDESPERPSTVRALPLEHGELVAFAKKRNPMNHVAVMARRSAVERAGGYRDMPGFEDYDLWIRMLQSGARLGNLPDVLVDVRAGADMFRRRGGKGYIGNLRRFYGALLESGFISRAEYIGNMALRIAVAAMPNGLRRRLYEKKLRKKAEEV